MVDVEHPETSEPESSGVLRKLIIGIGVIVGLIVLFLIGGAVIPRWWAQRMGGVIDGRLIFGSFLGLVMGFLFTFLPLVLLRLGVRYRRGHKRALSLVVLAVLLAAPNLATLGIVFGTSSAAHAGERILDVDGPGFRGGSLVGSVLAVIAVFGLGGLLMSRRRNKNKASKLKAELADRD